jgi:hypothetical protein
MMVQDSTTTEFQTFLPGCIDYAEQRIYRELDLLVSRVTNNSANFTTNEQAFVLPTASGIFVVVEQINAITPAGSDAQSGTRIPLIPVTKEFINAAWPSHTANTGVPQFFAPVSNTEYIVAPSPDAAYSAEVIGTVRPAPLSSTNTTTYLTTYLPDLFMAASMVFAMGYQRDFGSQSDNPQASASWEAEYQKLISSANLEELRKRFMGPAWQSMTPSPVATPPRV